MTFAALSEQDYAILALAVFLTLILVGAAWFGWRWMKMSASGWDD